ncbi:MAG: L-2-hydroxyglutarate oxidase [Bacteroidetes bacterium QS_8_68_15]|nr:MAG: L-2-hydroxyglutarate oxidase [Bacteroidetes bacterium QS_8_68_15]
MDTAIIGGGIVGLATAYHLAKTYPERSVVVLEKEDRVAAHQTGRNSGVIHSGIYYTPGSLKAQNCREGKRRLQRFCSERGVDYEMCGKVIVAADESEIPGLREIERKGRANEIEYERIGPECLAEIEPHVRGVEALRVPNAGIVDYTGMAEALADAVRERGHEVRTAAGVTGMDVRSGGVVLQTEAGPVEADHVVNCAGLYADRLAAMSGAEPDVQVVPFRGEYYELTPEARRLCNGLIYPVPDPAFPFLGVHFTKTITGGVECGPSAVLAFAREGYLFGDVHWRELAEILSFPGFWRLAARHWQKGLLEIAQSLSTRYYLRALRHLIPGIERGDLRPAASGVRAQALTRSGELVDDFLITETERVVNVLNAASPAATAALAVGEHIGERLARRF